MNIQTLIKARRKELGLSLERLADTLEKYGYRVERQTISHWEHGRNNPPIESENFRTALALSLDMDVNDLLTQIGMIKTDDERSPESRRAAELIDLLPIDQRKKAVNILETVIIQLREKV